MTKKATKATKATRKEIVAARPYRDEWVALQADGRVVRVPASQVTEAMAELPSFFERDGSYWLINQ